MRVCMYVCMCVCIHASDNGLRFFLQLVNHTKVIDNFDAQEISRAILESAPAWEKWMDGSDAVSSAPGSSRDPEIRIIGATPKAFRAAANELTHF